MSTIKIIDLFAGMGGIRLGFEKAFKEKGIDVECVMTSEIKAHALKALNYNFTHKKIVGDITKIDEKDIPDFDFLLGGFPCQAFSSAGNRDGFCDTRGTLFFEIERILKAKKPQGFLLENVEGLVSHDDGKTLNTIVTALKDLNYKVSWKVIDSKDFSLPQSRKRIYILGTLNKEFDFSKIEYSVEKKFKDIQEIGLELVDSVFTQKLLSHFSIEEIKGKAIKDKRGGPNNINSWDFELKGKVTEEQKNLLQQLFKKRRLKKWSEEIGIAWMDGIPLTISQIETFYKNDKLEELLNDLTEKGYLRFEHPKAQIRQEVNGNIITRREYAINKPKGYNIVTGKLSFEFSKILDPNGLAPTIVAADVEKIGVVDGSGIRRLSLREGLRLFGYPESYSLDMFSKNTSSRRKAFDLLGNTVAVPVVYSISKVLSSLVIVPEKEEYL
jgi:DNA (cytosine-5)-methyltransferase 1